MHVGKALFRTLLACVIVWCAMSGPVAGAVDVGSLPLGQLNVGDGSIIFANALKECTVYLEGDSQTEVQLDARGFLTRMPSGVHSIWYLTGWRDARGDQTDDGYYGVWVLTWEGDGAIVLNGADRRHEILLDDPAARRMVVKLPPGESPLVEITAINPDNYLRNMKLWPPAVPGAGSGLTASDRLGPGQIEGNLEPVPGAAEPVFHPRRLEHFRQAAFGVLRPMDWLHVNGSDLVAAGAWEARRPRDYATQGGAIIYNHATNESYPIPGYKSNSGMAYEYLIELANALDCDLWLQPAHDASEAYLRAMARLVAGKAGHVGLDPGLRIWIELSNEFWNPVEYYMQQVNYARDVAAAHFGVSREDIEPISTRHGWGAGHLQGLALNVFADEWTVQGRARKDFIAVAAGFTHGPDYNAAVIDAVREVDRNLPDVFAVAHYFGAIADQFLGMGYAADGAASEEVYAQAFRLLNQDIFRTTVPAVEANVALCREKGRLPLVGYEGGQHLVAPIWLADQPGYVDFLHNVNRRPEMAAAYRLMFAGWTAAGAMTASVYSDVVLPARWGSFGAKEYLRQPVADAPKWRAFIEWLTVQRQVRRLGDPLGHAPTVTSGSQLPMAEVGRPYSAGVAASGGDGHLSFSLLSDLPAGLALIPAGEGLARIVGVPTASGSHRLMLRVLDRDNDPAYQLMTLRIEERDAGRNTLILFKGEDVAMPPGVDHLNLRRQVQQGGREVFLPFAFGDGNHFFDLDPVSNLNMYGGIRLTTEGPGDPSVWCRLDAGNPGYFGLQSGASGESPWNLETLLVWRKDQFQNDGSARRVAFGATASTATLRVSLASLDPDVSELRFVIRDGDVWYVSEAAYSRTTATVFELKAFNNSGEPGKRWAAFSPTAHDFSPPANLTFTARDFTDVQAVGLAYRGERFGWHWDFSFDEVLVLADLKGGVVPGAMMLLLDQSQ
ncbi:MAG: hypothetical protein RDU30_00805 [Desulfovibrionaceae bacterium]|nr:hypothetical protein [Desulfovibrionaceae bacterium]